MPSHADTFTNFMGQGLTSAVDSLPRITPLRKDSISPASNLPFMTCRGRTGNVRACSRWMLQGSDHTRDGEIQEQTQLGQLPQNTVGSNHGERKGLPGLTVLDLEANASCSRRAQPWRPETTSPLHISAHASSTGTGHMEHRRRKPEPRSASWKARPPPAPGTRSPAPASPRARSSPLQTARGGRVSNVLDHPHARARASEVMALSTAGTYHPHEAERPADFFTRRHHLLQASVSLGALLV